MIPGAWLARFRQIEVLDLDPLARPLFAIRHGRALDRLGVRWHWHGLDALAYLEEMLVRWPDAVLFFDNLLGQQIYRCAEGEVLERWLESLHGALRGRLWGSVHDYLSGPARAAGSAFAVPIKFELSAEGGVRCLNRVTEGEPRSDHAPDPYRSYGVLDTGQSHGVLDTGQSHELSHERLYQQAGGRGIWQDHLTAGIFPVGTRGVMIPWRFSQTRLHWLQAAWVDARAQ
jgi:hypothetical protein